jgi:hypothetical protein
MISDLIVAAVAFAAGNLVGWFARIMWQTRAITKGIDRKMDDLTHRMDERGAITLERARDLVVLLMLVVVIYAAVMSSRASDKVAEQQAERNRSVACLSKWATEFGQAIDARAARSTATTEARDRMDAAEADVFDAITAVLAAEGSPATVATLRDSLNRYERAYAAVAAAVEAQGETGAANPYPDPPQRCYGP